MPDTSAIATVGATSRSRATSVEESASGSRWSSRTTCGCNRAASSTAWLPVSATPTSSMSSASSSHAEASMRNPSESSHSRTVIGVEPASTQPDGTPVMPSAESGRPLQHDDRDLAVGFALIVVVGGPRGGHGAPQLRLRVRGRGARPRGEHLVANLHLDIRILLEVHVPGGRHGGAALRCDDQVVVAMALVDQRGGALLAAPATGRGEEERGRPLPVVSMLAAGLAVALDVRGAEEVVVVVGGARHGCYLPRPRRDMRS